MRAIAFRLRQLFFGMRLALGRCEHFSPPLHAPLALHDD
ncbi:MAG: hypothetical protein QOJ15_5516 [Bradyrhizobium sp.]|jgi:hypothetical protein|nr:hypothetical protein [Bradyrhizobium sp.]